MGEGIAKSSAVLNPDSDILDLGGETDRSHNHTGRSDDIRIINLISQSVNAYSFIQSKKQQLPIITKSYLIGPFIVLFQGNSHTFMLLVAISMLSVFLLLLFLLLIRMIYFKQKLGKKTKQDEKMKSTTIRRASGLSDIDELSLVMDPNEYVHLSTIQRKSNPSTSTFNAKNKVVRYSNSQNAGLGKQESETSPRSFNQEHASDIHFFYG